jgi:hypothetical protein
MTTETTDNNDKPRIIRIKSNGKFLSIEQSEVAVIEEHTDPIKATIFHKDDPRSNDDILTMLTEECDGWESDGLNWGMIEEEYESEAYKKVVAERKEMLEILPVKVTVEIEAV